MLMNNYCQNAGGSYDSNRLFENRKESVMTNKVVHVIGGGTRFHIDPHLYLGSKATGKTARRIAELCRARPEMDVKIHLTAMAEPILEMPDAEQGPAHHVGRWINNPLDTN